MPRNTQYRPIRYPKNDVPSTFVRDGDAILSQFCRIKLRFRFFELEALILTRHHAPEINLVNRRRHSRINLILSLACPFSGEFDVAFEVCIDAAPHPAAGDPDALCGRQG